MPAAEFAISKSVLLWIVLAPLLGAIVAGLFGRRIGRAGAHSVTILGVAISCALSMYVLWQLLQGAAPRVQRERLHLVRGRRPGGPRRLHGRQADRDDDGGGDLRVAAGARLHHRLHGRRPGYQRFFSYISCSPSRCSCW
jgi:NADH-quinone oxidoreductase subunit L